MCQKVLLFDLDGTLLRSDKSISKRTLNALERCREQGYLIGISTSRSEKNSQKFIAALCPDIVISCGGALVKYDNDYIYTAEFSLEETSAMIKTVKEICGDDCEMTIDTVSDHYWNYKVDPNTVDATWGDTIYTDFSDFSGKALKVCAEIRKPAKALELAERFADCDCVKFSESDWYKFTKKSGTKENAIIYFCESCGFLTGDIIAFGDDLVDIGMLKLCGKGIAMGNAVDEVKSIADLVIGSNDNDGIEEYLTENILKL